jgi:glycerophosphoryl diester phosphodiesterase
VAAMIIAHRGGAPHLGENTSMAFDSALASGADMLEMDVQRSADGHLVVIHDATVEVSPGIHRPVSSLPLRELRRAVAGFLTFEEFLEQYGSKLPTNVDIKRSGYELEIVTALRRHGLTEQMLVSSRDASALRRVKFYAPETSIGLSRGQLVPWLGREPHSAIAAELLRPTLPIQLLAHGDFAMADTFMLNYRLITPWLVRYLHGGAFRVSCWTANDPETVRWLIDIGVDYIATDHPDRIVEFLQG